MHDILRLFLEAANDVKKPLARDLLFVFRTAKLSAAALAAMDTELVTLVKSLLESGLDKNVMRRIMNNEFLYGANVISTIPPITIDRKMLCQKMKAAIDASIPGFREANFLRLKQGQAQVKGTVYELFAAVDKSADAMNQIMHYDSGTDADLRIGAFFVQCKNYSGTLGLSKSLKTWLETAYANAGNNWSNVKLLVPDLNLIDSKLAAYRQKWGFIIEKYP